MSKRKRALTQKELKNIAEEIDINDISDNDGEDYSSDDSIQDPGWLPGSNKPVAGSSSEEDFSEEEGRDMRDVIQELLLQENEEDFANQEIEEEASREEVDEIAAHGVWSDYIGRHKVFLFTGPRGLQQQVPNNLSPTDVFNLIVDDEVIGFIVTETNRFAEQKIASQRKTKSARINKWSPTNNEEVRRFLGLTLWMGLVKLSTLKDYWSTRKMYKQDVPQSTMSRNRYQLLLAMIHFNNNETIEKGNRLGKIQPLVNLLRQKFQALFSPGENIVIDETLVPWRGRLIFRQYIPNKAHRYGIKLFKLCSSEGYTWSLIVYSGKSATGEKEMGLAQNVCLKLLDGMLDQGRTLYVDNFYTSYDLAKTLLARKTHIIGTLRANKKDLPKEVLQANLKRGEMVSREDESGVVVLKWKDTRDVRLLSTKHAPIMVSVRPAQSANIADTQDSIPETQTLPPLIDPQPSTSKSCIEAEYLSDQNPTVDTEQLGSWRPEVPDTLDEEENTELESSNIPRQVIPQKRGRKSRKATEKPSAILAYNKGKAGIDLSDQMGSYVTTLRKGVKWYRKLGLELLLGTAIVNAWVVYKYISGKKITIIRFRENLIEEILQLESAERPEKAKKSKTKTHLIKQRIDETGKKIRRKCCSCYSKAQHELGRKEARKKSKMVFTFCSDCPGSPQLCLDCFNSKHS